MVDMSKRYSFVMRRTDQDEKQIVRLRVLESINIEISTHLNELNVHMTQVMVIVWLSTRRAKGRRRIKKTKTKCIHRFDHIQPLHNIFSLFYHHLISSHLMSQMVLKIAAIRHANITHTCAMDHD